eukprot:GHVN01048920.1.p1 GENE.GHVN01048920.1~~GHVN01048920.1.p1  ORF type:complete len:110 (+),score=30.71 GHVN01048920.1:292-621(+)
MGPKTAKAKAAGKTRNEKPKGKAKSGAGGKAHGEVSVRATAQIDLGALMLEASDGDGIFRLWQQYQKELPALISGIDISQHEVMWKVVADLCTPMIDEVSEVVRAIRWL